MTDSDPGIEFRREMETVIAELCAALPRVVGGLDTRRALSPDARSVLADFREPLPVTGCGASASSPCSM